jgi:hypothetical protein
VKLWRGGTGRIRARDAVRSLDKEQPVNAPRTMNDIIARTFGAVRLPMTLLWIFSAPALVLSAVGIFGVMSYTVGRSTQEIAIRMALGAAAPKSSASCCGKGWA